MNISEKMGFISFKGESKTWVQHLYFELRQNLPIQGLAKVVIQYVRPKNQNKTLDSGLAPRILNLGQNILAR